MKLIKTSLNASFDETLEGVFGPDLAKTINDIFLYFGIVCLVLVVLLGVSNLILISLRKVFTEDESKTQSLKAYERRILFAIFAVCILVVLGLIVWTIIGFVAGAQIDEAVKLAGQT